MMLNLDMLINSELVPQEVLDVAIRVNQGMLDIMMAGATGEF
jgi:Flp pilus assembly CpaF family ATPase